LCWDGGASQQFKQITSIEEAEYIVRALVSQAHPAVGIDMVHHQGDIRLSILTHICTFGNKVTDKFVVPFCGALLVGSLRITVEYPGSPDSIWCEFNMRRIGKLASVIRKA
jgi:hypothetical protein